MHQRPHTHHDIENPQAQNQMAQPYWLYDRHGKRRFIAYADYRRFMAPMAQSGAIGFWEKLWLRAQSFYPKHSVTERLYRNGWAKLHQILGMPIQDAFLARTEHVKHSLYEGYIATEDRTLAVIAHRHVDDAIMAVHQANFIHYYFHPYFTVIKPVKQDDNLVLYPIVADRPVPYKLSDMLFVIYSISARYSDIYRDNTKPALDYVHLNLPSLLHQHGQMALWKEVRAVLTALPALPSVPTHGQMSLRHIKGGDHNLPILLRYERAGWHIPYYDWLHIQCDKALSKGKAPDIIRMMQDLQRESGLPDASIQAIALLYLLDQLAHDLQDKNDFKALAPVLDKRINHIVNAITKICHNQTKS